MQIYFNYRYHKSYPTSLDFLTQHTICKVFVDEVIICKVYFITNKQQHTTTCIPLYYNRILTMDATACDQIVLQIGLNPIKGH